MITAGSDPSYPQAMYDEILSHVNNFGSCWDCATGNGQMATVLAQRFQNLKASDISQQQLDHAPQLPNVQYVNCRAEQTPFATGSFDLITVGQAVHWFDHEAFNAEVTRVSKPNGILVLVGYGLMFVNPDFDAKLLQFYDGTIGSYWDPERKHIDSHYRSIPFPFDEIEMEQQHSIDVNWSLRQLEGYLGTWSSVKRYIEKNGKDPVAPFIQELRNSRIWTDDQKLDVHFPLFIRAGRMRK